MVKVCMLFLSIVAHARATQPLAEDVSSVSNAIQKLASSLYLEEMKQSPDQNVVLSPLSIHLAMSMLLYGAAGNSSKQLELALGLEGVKKENHLKEVQMILEKYNILDDENTTLSVANALFVSDDFEVKPEFVNLVENQFEANVTGLDFDDTSYPIIINEWAAKKTNNLINKLAPEEGLDDIGMVLMNAVYFKAKWLEQFVKEETRKGIFSTGKVDIETDFMYLSAKIEYTRSEELSAVIVALPYIDEDYKMLVFLPEESSSVEHLELALFNNSKATSIQQHLTRMKKRNIDLLFPKFEIGSELSLVKHFQHLGVLDIFGADANFSGISSKESHPIGDIVHKTKIEVSEEGSEAAAATAVFATKVFIPNKKITVSSPFIFFIMDIKNSVPIFMGKIVNPSGKTENEEHEKHEGTVEEAMAEDINLKNVNVQDKIDEEVQSESGETKEARFDVDGESLAGFNDAFAGLKGVFSSSDNGKQ